MEISNYNFTSIIPVDEFQKSGNNFGGKRNAAKLDGICSFYFWKDMLLIQQQKSRSAKIQGVTGNGTLLTNDSQR